MDGTMSTGAPRVMLLVLVTSLFSFVWSNDHKPETPSRTVVAYNFDSPCRVARIAPALPEESVSGTLPVSIPVSESTPSLDQFTRFPTSLTPGTFQLTDDAGNLFEVTIVRVSAQVEPVTPLFAEELPVEPNPAGECLKHLVSTAYSEFKQPIGQLAQPFQEWLAPHVELTRSDDEENVLSIR